jgi:hypothetical protein
VQVLELLLKLFPRLLFEPPHTPRKSNLSFYVFEWHISIEWRHGSLVARERGAEERFNTIHTIHKSTSVTPRHAPALRLLSLKLMMMQLVVLRFRRVPILFHSSFLCCLRLNELCRCLLPLG